MNLSQFTEEDFKKAFQSIDKDGNGYISLDEIRYFLTVLYDMKDPPEEEVKKLMTAFDKNKDGKVSYEEFKKTIPKIQEEVKKETKSNTAVTTNSADSMRRLRQKHVRGAAGPRQQFAVPMTTAQEIGWQAASTAENNKNDPRVPKNSCDETTFASDMIKSGIYY
eukprot:CAMPEP_0184485008 /NCGR_PEP_ID=MMETSP0113_2-20130426/6661_1 /TAXON_ID=91329 /ORGANISM="Norrisiella sphaerica, Strain BC52" /LENGTH=164 /DNA_ID=CAMNT_0026866253 /DNA_START=32 /DNA_END=526 /DNA_ORIENTATION=+